VAPDGKALGFLPLPDPLTTNLCFDAEEKQMFVTLSGSGRLAKIDWQR
jgi:gluconolactonase